MSTAGAREDHLLPLLDYLKSERGFDFTGYKRASLERRIAKRMEEVGARDHAAYLDHLEVHPDEFSHLFNTILINVTGFFRDEHAWAFLRGAVEEMLGRIEPEAPVRVWSAGCASGEEAFSLAMLLVDLLGEDEFRRRVKIYATDVDEEALARARVGVYTVDELEGVPDDLRERCFERAHQRHVFRPELRRAVIFGRNDLVQDSPISRVDLLACRNTLMYFNAETQARILNRFHFALRDSGLLFLGRSEMLITHSHLFTPLNLKHRVFTKVRRPSLRDRVAMLTHTDDGLAAPTSDSVMRESAFDSVPVAQIVVDVEGVLTAANERARALLGLGAADVGRPLPDLSVAYRPTELLPLIEQARTHRQPVVQDGVEWGGSDGEHRVLDVRVTPLVAGGDVVGVGATFVDVTRERRINDELERAKGELETAYEELQSTVEELETTNEELQSTNEELETTNEELQSTNEELATTNDELRLRGVQLDHVNSVLEAILTSLEVALTLVDTEQRVQLWNSFAENLWGLRADEAQGRHVLGLDIGLPVESLRRPLKEVLAGEVAREDLVLDAVSRRGRSIRCGVAILPIRTDSAISGAIVSMDPLDGAP